MLWIPRFDFTLYLAILCTVFDVGYLYILYHYSILSFMCIFLIFLVLCVSKTPVFIIAQVHFNRRLLWMGGFSILLSIVLSVLCNTMLFLFGHILMFHPLALATFGLSFVTFFFQCWLMGNIVILRVLLIRDVTLPSRMSLLEMQNKADEIGDAIPYI